MSGIDGIGRRTVEPSGNNAESASGRLGFLDPLIAVVALVLLSPLLLLAAIAIVMDTGFPVLYRQVRIGKDRRPFVMYKFRTMVRNAELMDGGQSLSSDDERITRAGHWLRVTSLDELPQLLNIARGEMTFIGPRPGMPDQVERYTQHQLRRLEVRPGLTGWAQTHGRNLLSWEERIEHDIWYVDHRTPLLDLRVIARTALVLLTGEGLYGADGHNPDLGELHLSESDSVANTDQPIET